MRAQVTVVGGGIIGMSIAWRLAQRDYRVRVIDSGVIGGQASWAGAGMLAPGGEIDGPSRWGEFAIGSLRLYPDFVRELRQETGVPIDFREPGAVENAFNAAEWDRIVGRAAVQRDLGIPCLEVPATIPNAYRAMSYPEDALVDPREVVAALRTACTRLGVELHEHEPVRFVNGHVVSSVRAYPTDAVVLSAGAWSSEIEVKGVELTPSFPVRGHLISYQLAPGALPLIQRHGHTYVLQRSSGLVIAGSSTEQIGFVCRIDPSVVADIAARAEKLVPALRSAPIVDTWIGFRPATGNFQPEIGRVANTNVYLAYGHYRNGILMAPATAAEIVRQISASLEKGSLC